jgi:4-hydroxymandelate oxidase
MSDSASSSATAAPVNVFEYQEMAREALPKMVYDYYAGGARDEITLGRNHSAYDDLDVRYRVMRDISSRSTAASVLGTEVDLPVLIAPTAFHRMACEEGELATVRAAGRMGTVMILSTLSTTDVEAVVEAASRPVWFQLYVYTDRDATRDLVRRAEAAGCEALVLTVDAQVWGVRERDEKNNFTLPEGITMKNLEASGKPTFPDVEGSGLAAYVNQNFDKALTWDDLDWLAGLTDLPVLVKGVVRGDDAARAAEHGAAGVVVSNHGGRQLDTSPATIDVLPEVVDALTASTAGREVDVIVDGGIRRGTDVLKALALGADAVAVGRPVLWGLAAGGEDGAVDVLTMLRDELDVAMALSGASSIEDLTPDLVRRR